MPGPSNTQNKEGPQKVPYGHLLNRFFQQNFCEFLTDSWLIEKRRCSVNNKKMILQK